MKSKEKIREELIEKRNSLSYEEAERKSLIILDKLKQHPDYKNAKTVMFYVSKDKEVMTHDMIKNAIEKKKVIVPKMVDNGIVCCEVTDFDQMTFGCFGVLEPGNTMTCDLSEIDLVIVPGVAFDKEHNRIGYGKGYYDKLLKEARAKKIALAYNFQLVDSIPAEEWDIKVDEIISD
jgi:5-formyltetrahydrofolate cyclo-ligase